MRDRGKPFVLYRRGPMSFTIVPRGVKGWLQFVIWLALLAPLIAWFAHHTGQTASGPDYRSALALLLVGLVIWSIGGVWWMIARATVIDTVELQRDRQRERRRQQRERLQQGTASPAPAPVADPAEDQNTAR